MKKETKDSIRGFIAFVVIVAGFIFMIELGWLDFLRNPNDFRECQLTYGRTQCSELLDND